MDNTSEQNLFLNRFVLGAQVAEGGSAKIFRVSDTWFPERKLIAKVQRDDDPRLGRALQREYATLLMHPPINAPKPVLLYRLNEPMIIDKESMQGLVLIETEVEGLEWTAWLKTSPSNQAILLALATLTKSLHGLHLSGLRHGDIKPENILVPVDAPQNASWIDFGLSDRPGMLHGGTPSFLAPEALNGRPELASDLFALGKVIETVSTSADLRELANNLTSWNPRERFSANEVLERVQGLTGEIEPPKHHAPINPWPLWLDSFQDLELACQRRQGAAFLAEGDHALGAEAWVKTASAIAIKQGWDLITLDALSALLRSAEEEPTIDDPHHYVLESLRQQAQRSPVIVEAGQRIFESPAEQLALRFARNDEDYPGIVWLSWGESSSENPWPGRVVKVLSWSEQNLAKLTALYRPELVQPQKVTSKIALTCAGAAGSASELLWKHQSTSEPELWNLSESLRLPKPSLGQAVLALSREPLSLDELKEILTDLQTSDETTEDLESLILHNKVISTDGGQCFSLQLSTLVHTDLEAILDPTHLTAILNEIVRPLATRLIPTSLPWKAHISLVDLLETATYHHERKEWSLAAHAFRAAQDAHAEFSSEQIAQFVMTYARTGRVAEAIKLLETQKGHDASLLRANLLQEKGLLLESETLLEDLSATSPNPSVSLRLSRLKLRLGKFKEAGELLKTLPPDLPPTDALEKASIQGLIATFQGAPQEGATFLEPLVDAYTDNPELEGKAASSLALIYQKAGKTEEAKSLYLRSIACAEENYSTKVLLNRLTNLGTLEQDINDYGSAILTYKKSITLAKALNDTSALLRSGLNLANLQSLLGQYQEASLTLMPLKTKASESQFQTEAAYIDLLSLDMELQTATPPTNFTQRLKELNTRLERQGLNTAILETTLLQLKFEAFFTPTDSCIEMLFEWTHAQLNAGLNSLATQGLLALVRALVKIGDLTPFENVLAFIGVNVATRDNLELEWSERVLKAMSLTQNRNFEATEPVWAQAKAAHQRLVEKLPSGSQHAFFKVEPRQSLLRHQDEHVTQLAQPQSPNLPSVSRLFQMMRALAQETDTERLLHRILDSVVMLSGAERGLLILADKDDQTLSARATSGVYEAEDETRSFSTTIAKRAIEALQPIRSGNLQADSRFNSDHSVHVLSLQSTLCLPMHAPPHVKGALYLDHRMKANAFEDADISVLWAFADQAAIALANAYVIEELSSQKEKLETAQRELMMVQKELQDDLVKTRLEDSNLTVKRMRLEGPMAKVGVVTGSQAMFHIAQMVDKVSDTSLPVTIAGESGTGKELIARAIHEGSSISSTGHFVALNCGAVADGLWESELFGHERGAFTGANREKPGLFEVAQDGTLFLDEIGDLPLDTQVKLLRVLQQGEFRRVGGHKLLRTNARIVCATHRSLEKMVKEGTFREDLWYRLNVIELQLPALRDRPEDIPLLVQHFLKRYGTGRTVTLTTSAQRLLQNHRWPGNIRELENEIQRALALCDEHIEAEHLSKKFQNIASSPAASTTMPGSSLGPLKPQVELFERHYIERVLEACDGNRTRAAKALGLTRPGFYKKLKTLGMN